MKVYLTDEETAYIHKLITASTMFYHPYVQAFQVLSELVKKVEPPRAYLNLNSNEKANIAGLIKKTIEAIDAQTEKAAGDEAKLGELAKQKALIQSVLTKFDLAIEVPSL